MLYYNYNDPVPVRKSWASRMSPSPNCYNVAIAPMPVRVIETTRPSWLLRITDRVGAAASFVCAVHCALLPLVIALLPAIGLGILANHAFERAFIAFAALLAVVSLVTGYRRHRRFRAFWFLLPGVALMLAGLAVDFDARPTWHAVLVSVGGTLVALSHLANLRLAHRHVHDATCEHGSP